MKEQLQSSSLLILHGAVRRRQPTRGFTSGPLTSELDRGLPADDRAVHVGSQTGVLSYMLGFNGVADD